MVDNTQRFSGRAEDYERFRQRYPAEEIVTRLREWCGLQPSWEIADVGAGTGMLAEIFLEEGCRVVAVEPNDDMRRACERLRVQWPRLDVKDATAEATTLAENSVDMVAAGRAFHWFDKERAMAEFRRILRPGGWVVLISLGRAHDAEGSPFDEQAAAFERLLTEHGTDYAYVRTGYRVHENLGELFPEDAAFVQEHIAGTQVLDWESFRGQVQSLSVTPQRGDARYDNFERELAAYFARYSKDGALTMQTNCYMTAGRLD